MERGLLEQRRLPASGRRPGARSSLRLATRYRPRALAALAACVVGLTGLQAARLPGAHAWQTIWAEDGREWLSGALGHSFVDQVTRPYNGYVHMVPRAIGAFVSVFPIERAALLFALISCALVSLLAAYVYLASSELLRSRWARLLVAAFFALASAVASELVATATNLHFYLVYACFWALLYRPKGRWEVAAGSAVVLATTLSDFLCVLFLPVALFRWVASDVPRERIVPALYTGSLAVQLALGPLRQSVQGQQGHLADLPGIYAERVTGSLLVGDEELAKFWRHFHWLFAYGTLVVVVAAGAFLVAAVGTRSVRVFFLVCVAYSLLFFGLTLMTRGTTPFKPVVGRFSLDGSRYMYLPISFLMTAFVAAVDERDSVVGGVAWRNFRRAFVASAVAVLALNYSMHGRRSDGPSWPDSVTNARRDCVARHLGEVSVLTAPKAPPVRWAAKVPCARL